MPEDGKKNDKKNAKEQRKPRQRHQQGNKTEKKPEKIEDTPSVPKVPQKPPVYDSPPPEFFKNLKRETDEILKITEEENSKYKKKEIQSNWSKYEVPIESYEEIDEQENMGADFEKLIQEPLVAGGHFQFKHEKSWDINTGPTQYDKYFEIDMEDLNTAVCSIPFYERNNIEQSIFKESDILTMNNRSSKFKQKYYNDKSYSTPETEAHDKILNSLRDDINKDNSTELEVKCNINITFNTESDNKILGTKDVRNPTDKHKESTNKFNTVDYSKDIKEKVEPQIISGNIKSNAVLEEDIEFNDFIFHPTEKAKIANEQVEISNNNKVSDARCKIDIEYKKPIIEMNIPATVENNVLSETQSVTQTTTETNKIAAIESPEDLEKWLDDFLDG